MAFALNHAVAHDLERIIYVIPFTTIIEQNAAVFKQSLGEENVSAAPSPAWCSFRMPMICSSLNLLFRMRLSPSLATD